MTDQTHTIGDQIRSDRERAGMSQAGLATAMRNAGREHWRQTTVSRIERGDQVPDVEDLVALNKVLGYGLMHHLFMEALIHEQVSEDDFLRTDAWVRIRQIESTLTETQTQITGALTQLAALDFMLHGTTSRASKEPTDGKA